MWVSGPDGYDCEVAGLALDGASPIQAALRVLCARWRKL